MPLAGKSRALRDDPIDLSTIPEADKTKENRGAVGIKHDSHHSGSHTANAASGTIGGDTPPPIFDRAAIAAGQKGALATDRVDARLSTGSMSGTGPAAAPPGAGLRTTGTGQTATARGTPKPGALADKIPPGVDLPPARANAPAPPPVIVDDDLQDLPGTAAERAPPGGPRAVPLGELGELGELDDSQAGLDQDKRRAAHGQATTRRDAASALLGLAEPAPLFGKPPVAGAPGGARIEERAVQLRGDATFNDASGSSTGRFERGDPTLGDARGDPTLGDARGDATALSAPAPGHAAAGTLRNAAALPRKRGIAGDMRYVVTVVFGVREANRELAVLAARQATRQQSRRHHLVTLGRTAVTLPEWIHAGPQRGEDHGPAGSSRAEHPALGPARAQLAGVEDERAQHAGQVAAADAELTRVRGDREARAKQYLVDAAALDAELASLAKRLEPLDKEAAGIKRRAADLRDALRRIDGKIAAAEASLQSVKADKLDRAGVQAEIASLRADRKAIQRDEPEIAGQLDALNPRIAALEAARTEAQRKRAELVTGEQEDQRRAEEMLIAIGAKRKVVDRATADAEALRDKILFQLGERLCVDRPDHLTGQLAPIDEIDVELGVADRRMMELREITSSVDKRKVARGVALIVVLAGALAALVTWIVSLAL